MRRPSSNSRSGSYEAPRYSCSETRVAVFMCRLYRGADFPTPPDILPPCYYSVLFEETHSVKVYESKDIRTVGVVGHGDSGKTTLTAGLLFTSGASSRL